MRDPFALGLDLDHTAAAQSDDGTVLTLRLPFPPSVNDFKIPHPKIRGVYFLTKRAKQFREDVGWLCAGARRFGSAEVELDIVLHPPDRLERDADNFATKALFDALQAARIVDNDKQIKKYTVEMCSVAKGGALIVKIWERGSAKS